MTAKHYLERNVEKRKISSNNTQLHIKLDFTNLWKLLIDKQKKKEDLKRDAGISSASIARINKGENVTTEVIIKICEALDCKLEDIMKNVEE